MLRRALFARSLLMTPAFAGANATKGPNDRVRVALIGLRGRGRDLLKCLHAAAKDNVELAALCDVDDATLQKTAAGFQQVSGRTPALHHDLRRVFDDKSIDAVAIATPNHWHALATVWACQAGQDVYCEKPGTHSYWEGLKVMEAAAKYNRIVQHGTQNRSSANIAEGIRKLKEGVIGRVHLARGVAYKYRASIPKAAAATVPAGLNWDLWQGPAAAVPYQPGAYRSSGGGWHLMWNYGNGEIGNQGVHELDIMRWALDLDAHPTKVSSFGGAYVHRDGQECPQVQSTQYEWAGRDVLVTFETRGGYTNTEAGMGAEYPFLDHQNVVGNLFIGSDGYMIMPDYTSYYTFLGRKREKGPSAVGSGLIETQPHIDNFVAAVRSRKTADLHADARELHHSSALAHFANISVRTGRTVYFDAARHAFRQDAEATALLRRRYRAPYVIPEKV